MVESRIRLLDEQTINQIAAGEVIENPASVVKELVENSIDAGATEIKIEIQAGGRNAIRISDNGCGMNRDDALLCLERHATSKARNLEDVYHIGTMGFRGEAIPSIASISKFTLITCPQPIEDDYSSSEGTLITVEGGKILECSSVARSPGTTVEVKSLFFNVPVRKNFQRSPSYDAQEIVKIIIHLALAHPYLHFRLISDQKTEISTAIFIPNVSFEQRLRERVNELIGSDFLEMSRYVDHSDEEFRLQGFIGLPSYTRPNKTGQMLFINRRVVQSSFLSYAVKTAYGAALSANRYPTFLLHVSLEKEAIDVNVHPQKKEVRLRQEERLKRLIFRAVPQALQQDFSSISPQGIENPFGPSQAIPQNGFFSSNFKELLDNSIVSKEALKTEKTNSCGIPTTDLPLLASSSQKPTLELPHPNNWKNCSFNSTKGSEVESREPSLKLQTHSSSYSGAVKQPEQMQASISIRRKAPKVLGTIYRYFIADDTASGAESLCADGFLIIQHRAVLSRITFDQMIKRSHVGGASQSLLVPYLFDVSPVELPLLIEQLETLQQMGIIIRQISPKGFVVDALPDFLAHVEMRVLVTRLMAEMAQRGSVASSLEDDRIKSLALAVSRSITLPNRPLYIQEAQTLVDTLMESTTPLLCPLGKSTMVPLRDNDLQKWF